jgi:hypothetical protein
MSHIKDRLIQLKNEVENTGNGAYFSKNNISKIVELLFTDLEQDEKENGWIPVSERLPDGDDCRYFMCLLENHLEDAPIFLQYNESGGFGFYTDIYDPVTLGFVDTEFSTVKELGYEEVLYWRELLNPPEEDEP